MNWSVYVGEHYLVHGWNEQLVEFIYCTYKWILICCVILYWLNATEHYYTDIQLIAYDLSLMVYDLRLIVYDLWWFMIAHGSNLWYIPIWELVPDMTRTDLGKITCKWYIQFTYYLLISVENYKRDTQFIKIRILRKVFSKQFWFIRCRRQHLWAVE